MRKSTAPSTRRSPAGDAPNEPVSETRPIAASSADAPSPREQIRMGEIADRYCARRAEAARLNEETAALGTELLCLMKKLGRTSIPTAAGTVSLKKGSAERDAPDADAMVEILKKLGIEIPTKKVAGRADGLEFRLAR